jgi:hypothetical protein
MLVFVKRLMAHIQKETEQPEIFVPNTNDECNQG